MQNNKILTKIAMLSHLWVVLILSSHKTKIVLFVALQASTVKPKVVTHLKGKIISVLHNKFKICKFEKLICYSK